MGSRPDRSPLQATPSPAIEERPRLLPRSPGPYTGASALWSSEKAARLGTPSHLACLKSMDGKALPNILDRCSMSFFQPPSLNTLEPYQLEFLESIFKQVWSQIVPRHYPLSPDLRQHLQTEISARLCSFVARGVMEPTVLLGLTVATVKSPRRKVRRRGRLGTPHPVGD